MVRVKRVILIIVILMLLLLVSGAYYLYYTGYSYTDLATDDVGYVTKEVYNFYDSDVTMVLITGIHPREKLAINPEIDSARLFALTHKVNLVVYNTTVTKDPEKFAESRKNGEYLVANYILPDINATKDAQVVIISHSHVPSYGEGFYVATPAMDNASVDMANKIKNGGIDFNYYPVTGNETYKSTSAVLVSRPLADSGYPTLVYEIPEDITEQDSTRRTYELFEKCYGIICNI